MEKLNDFNELFTLDKNYYFVSPHLDDAIFSAGALIYELKDKKRPVTIITVFTNASSSDTPEARKFLQSSGFITGTDLFKKRQIEDIKVCRYLGINHVHLGFLDVLWRDDKKTRIKKQREKVLQKAIAKKLLRIIDDKKAIVFAPLGVGKHPDHIIINQVCKDNFTDVIFWEDYPYNLNTKISLYLNSQMATHIFEVKKNIFKKENLMNFYGSQIKSLFSDKPIILKKEKFYYFL